MRLFEDASTVRRREEMENWNVLWLNKATAGVLAASREERENKWLS